MRKRRIMILGAAGRDFHNFNVVYRDDPDTEVVAFTATQIPHIDERLYPPSLSGPLYPKGIPIYSETELETLVREHSIHAVVFSYSDVSYEHLGHVASRALAAGANVGLLGTGETMIESKVPVVAVTAVRTGCGKSPTTRYLARRLRASGRRLVVIRHPMPYGDLGRQAVQRFATYEDLDRHECTFEEREEYESHIAAGTVVYAGIDYAAILEQASTEADVLIWDGGNNDWPFYRPDVWVTLIDPLRAGHESLYFPAEVNLRCADVLVINKVEVAGKEAVQAVTAAAAQSNPSALILRTRSVVTVDGRDGEVAGKRVLCIEDGPTLTHGGMSFGAGQVAAEKYRAAEVVDPRPLAVGSIRETLERFPHIGKLLPAMGYYPEQVAELEASVRATDCDLVLIGTPFDLARCLKLDKPALRVQYAIEDVADGRDAPTLGDAVLERLKAAEAVRS